MKSIHDGVKHGCELCEYKKSWKNGLKQQLKSIHDEHKHCCKFCDYKGTQKGNLQQT